MSLGHTFLIWMSALLAAISLVPSDSVSSCPNDVSSNCLFTLGNGYGNWTLSNWSRKNNYVYLTNGTRSGSLESRCICATGSDSYCLKFQFLLKKINTYTLSVSLSSLASRRKLWRRTSSKNKDWTNAAVPVASDSNFTIFITASRNKKEYNKKIRIRNIVYNRSDCEIMPQTATPPRHTSTDRPTMTPATSTSTITTTSTTSKATAIKPITTRSSSTTSNSAMSYSTTPYSTSSSAISASSVQPDVSLDQSSTHVTSTSKFGVQTGASRESNSVLDAVSQPVKSSGTVAMIVGVAVAVVIVVTAGAFALSFIVIRRKRFPVIQTCRKNKKKDVENIKACHNNAYDLKTETVEENQNNKELNASDVTSSYVNFSDIATSRLSQPPVNEYSVIRDPDNDDWLSAFKPLTSLYSLAQARSHKTQASSENTGAQNHFESPYEINDDRENTQRPDESTRNGEYTKLDLDRKSQVEHCSTSDCNTQYSLLGSSKALSVYGESEATGVYHDLEEQSPFQAPRQGDEGACHIKEGTPAVERHGRVAGAHHILGQESTAQTSGQAREEEGSGHTLPQTPSEISDHPTATSDHLVLEEDSTSLTLQQAGGELYHFHEEPPPENTNVAEESLYHVLENDFAARGPGRGGGALCYNIEEAPTMEVQGRDRGVYHVLETDSAGEFSLSGTLEEFHDPDTALSDESAVEYSSLDFDGRSPVQERSDEATDYVYSHLHEGDEDVYNEVDRQKRRKVIDGDYSHIQLKF